MSVKKRIPKASKDNIDNVKIPNQSVLNLQVHVDGIKFSFETLEKTEYFNLDGTCANWSSDLFDMLKDVSGHTVADMVSGEYKRKYRVHNHEKAKLPSKLPAGVDCYQIRISSSKGGIHGVFSENIFYVIWLDPLHNMYPDDRYGGLRQIKPASNCCKDRDEEILLLKEKLREAEEEVKVWQELAESADNTIRDKSTMVTSSASGEGQKQG